VCARRRRRRRRRWVGGERECERDERASRWAQQNETRCAHLRHDDRLHLIVQLDVPRQQPHLLTRGLRALLLHSRHRVRQDFHCGREREAAVRYVPRICAESLAEVTEFDGTN
jgi:hypothetical protein